MWSQDPESSSSCSPSTVKRSRPDNTWTTAARDAWCSVSSSPASKANTVTSRSVVAVHDFGDDGAGLDGHFACKIVDQSVGHLTIMLRAELCDAHPWPERVRSEGPLEPHGADN